MSITLKCTNPRKIIESSKQLIKLQEEKIKNKINSLLLREQEKSSLPNSFELLLEKAVQPYQSKK